VASSNSSPLKTTPFQAEPRSSVTQNLEDGNPKGSSRSDHLSNWCGWTLLLLIVATGFGIRLDATSEPVWLDECHTAWTVDTDSPTTVIERAAIGNQPPLYPISAWLLKQTFGLTEFALRIPSLLSGTLLILFAALWTRSLTRDWSAAILVAALICFDGQFIYYSSEARCYALLQLTGLLQAICFWRLIHASRLTCESEASDSGSSFALWLAWTALSIALLYTHYTSVWILASEFIFIAGLAIVRRKLPTGFVVASLLTTFAIVPLAWNVSMVIKRRDNWVAVSSVEQLWLDYEPWLIYWILIPAVFAIAGWLMSSIAGASTTRNTSTSPHNMYLHWLWIGTWAAIGPVGIAVVDALQIAPMALERYAIVCWVAFAVFAGLAVSTFPKKVSWLIAVCIFGSSIFGNWWVSQSYELRRLTPFRVEDWTATTSQIANTNSGQPIFQFADVIEDIDALEVQDPDFQNYLKFPILGAEALAGQRVSETHSITPLATRNPRFLPEHLAAIREANGCWLVVRGDNRSSIWIAGELEYWMKERIEFKEIINERLPYSNVHLLRVRTVDD
jgi:hypothetical protein